MKLSKYNFFYTIDDDNTYVIAYNSKTNALATIENSNYSKLLDFINNGKQIDDESFIGKLKEGGYIVDDSFDELSSLRLKLLQGRFSTQSFSLTLTPTMDCNFDCIYCYEKEVLHNSKMSKELQKKIVSLIENKAKSIKHLHVSWFGGEPLIAFDVIENLSQTFIKICEENNVVYSASIITNGYLLTKEIANKFVELKIESAQITIDGLKEIHDKRRFLRNGKGTFDKIVKNIKEVSDTYNGIVIRVNIDNENKYDVDNILAVFKENFENMKINIYLGMVETLSGCYSKDLCVSKEQFSDITYNFNKSLSNINKMSSLNFYPKLSSNYCTADAVNSLIIDSEGMMYKCWSDIGDKNGIIDSIFDDKSVQENYSKLHEYLLYDPTQDTKCLQCNILPICMGGCPYVRNNNGENCHTQKYNLESYIKLCATELVQNIKNKEQG